MAEPPRRKRTRPVVPYGGQDGRSPASPEGGQPRGDASGRPTGAPGPPGSQRSRPVVLLVVFLVLAGMGWFLIQNLTQASKQQDCLMSGRRNCAPIDTSGK